jgi:hypothetical protein
MPSHKMISKSQTDEMMNWAKRNEAMKMAGGQSREMTSGPAPSTKGTEMRKRWNQVLAQAKTKSPKQIDGLRSRIRKIYFLLTRKKQ